jgi:hypothetical protein
MERRRKEMERGKRETNLPEDDFVTPEQDYHLIYLFIPSGKDTEFKHK